MLVVGYAAGPARSHASQSITCPQPAPPTPGSARLARRHCVIKRNFTSS